jgi:hypothetical protein
LIGSSSEQSGPQKILLRKSHFLGVPSTLTQWVAGNFVQVRVAGGHVYTTYVNSQKPFLFDWRMQWQLFLDRVSLCSPGWLWTHNPPTSAPECWDYRRATPSPASMIAFWAEKFSFKVISPFSLDFFQHTLSFSYCLERITLDHKLKRLGWKSQRRSSNLLICRAEEEKLIICEVDWIIVL